MATNHAGLKAWVEDVAKHTQPDRIVWCTGSQAEIDGLYETMTRTGEMIKLDPSAHPNCYYHRSNPTDVARTEHLTFICSGQKDDAGPTNNWMSPADAQTKVWPLFGGAMKGRTMYVVPYVMGPLGSPHAKVGVEITDSAYVVANMRIMTRMGTPALEALGSNGEYVKGLHSVGDLSPDRRFICHFPERREIWSVGSGYGGNALLGKKCFALRIASVQARDEGWLAEHMLILGLESPQGDITYICAAFPSACGKTNLAMLVPPASQKGWRIWTVGDDIAWLKFGADGRLYAVNPEAGFFGVAPGTSYKTNPMAMDSIKANTIFTNVLLTGDKNVWWEGMSDPPPSGTDWQGKPWTPQSGTPGAHPNSRFTAPARQCPCISPEWENPNGVPISAFVFGGRRARVAPLVVEAKSWRHGVFLGATVASERTAAAVGKVGEVRNDPFAMLPFCGYNMGGYFQHWLSLEAHKGAKLPKIFHVNWFRQDANGKFIWPGFGDNVRVLRWIRDRCQGNGAAVESPIGNLPAPGALDLSGLDLPPGRAAELLAIDPTEWRAEWEGQKKFFESIGPRMPQALWEEHAALGQRLAAWKP